jgi:hypothetical protein
VAGILARLEERRMRSSNRYPANLCSLPLAFRRDLDWLRIVMSRNFFVAAFVG